MAVIRLPHISNFTDFIPLEQHELLGVRYVQRARELGAPVEYDSKRRGFYYSEAFSLPATINTAQADDYVGILAAMSDISQDTYGGQDSIQMSIPYDAVLEIPDKLTVMKLGKIITGRVPSHRGSGENRYYCEFGSVEAFLGVLMALGEPVRIVSPDWLRERLRDNIACLLKANNETV